jgi:phosphopantetheinyl transferase
VIRIESPIPISNSCRLWIGSVDELPTSFPENLSKVAAIQLLSPTEQDRLNRYRIPQKKWQFYWSRMFAGEVLNRHFGTAEVRLEAIPGGQPVLRGLGISERCSVSLSHSDCLFAMVISEEGMAVGVDIEASDRLNTTDLHSLFQHSGTNSIGQSLDSRDADQLRLEWTAREAMWKALGGPDGYTVLQMPVVANSAGLSICGDLNGDLLPLGGLWGFQSGVPTLSQCAIPIKVAATLKRSFCGCVVELRRIGSPRVEDVAGFGHWNPRSFIAH